MGRAARRRAKFNEYLLEMTPELLDRFEKGLVAGDRAPGD
jgi:hypothetical protein